LPLPCRITVARPTDEVIAFDILAAIKDQQSKIHIRVSGPAMHKSLAFCRMQVARECIMQCAK
jgi:hypothetical protein